MDHLVVLLRGINVGRNKQIPMADLRALLEGVGYADVRTLLRSGNVVLATDQAPGDAARAIEDAIAERFGFDVSVIVRTGEELAAIVAANPHADVATDGSRHHVAFLDAEPDPAAIEELAAQDFEPERLSARGREIYVWCPNGLRDSRAIKALSEKRLDVTATVRNWNTVTKLAAMTG
jgi:uncharacterized protein (DUF1697 family)